MQSNIVKSEVIESEVVDGAIQDTAPFYLQAKIVITPANKDDYLLMLIDHLSRINTNITRLTQEVEEIKNSSNSLDLSFVHSKLDVIVDAFDSIPEWIPANSLQESSGLTADAIRAQLKNPVRFEPGVDYKKIGRIWYVHKKSISKIRRQK